MARFSIQHNINIITALAKSSEDAMTVLDAMDDIVDAACEECAMNPRCQFNDCEHCRLRQVHDQLTVEVLDKDEAHV